LKILNRLTESRLGLPTRADLAILGGGFTGLWAALLAKEADAQRDVVLIEADAAAPAGARDVTSAS